MQLEKGNVYSIWDVCITLFFLIAFSAVFAFLSQAFFIDVFVIIITILSYFIVSHFS